MLRFALLGPVAVGEDGRELVQQPAGIPTTVLSVLLLHANQVVPRDRLAAAVWGAEPPSAAAAGLRNHVSRLRRQLGPQAGARVQTVAPGYRIDVHDGELDLQRFLDNCARGQQASPTVNSRPHAACWTTRWRCGGATRWPNCRRRRS
jgi:DNA-binding SARP family transcriptional activator